MILPAWVNRESWDGWCEVRAEMKRVPFTERAKRIAIAKLEEWNAQGYDVNFILDHATLSGWRGLWLPIETPRRIVQRPATSNAAQMSLVNRAIEESQKTGRPADAILAELRRQA